MRKKSAIMLAALFAAALCLSACSGKKDALPQEELLTAVPASQVEKGAFYVKSGEEFYKLPMENVTFDTAKEAVVAGETDSDSGIVDGASERLAYFVYKDLAVPTLYKNDQLIFASSDAVPEFTWERFLDCGYSIGLSGLTTNGSGKVTSGASTRASAQSSAAIAVSQMEMPEGSVLTVAKINGVDLTEQYLNEAGIITGLSRDAAANVDFYIGSQYVPAALTADTRYFESFEKFKSDGYSLSTDGYAMVDVPDYLPSGYYLVNGTGFMKYLNVDRGVDEGGISLDAPYFYVDPDTGETLTYYEYNKGGASGTQEMPAVQQTGEQVNMDDYPEKQSVSIDSTQNNVNFSISWQYIDNDAKTKAARTGNFPETRLVDPMGNVLPVTSETAADAVSTENVIDYSVDSPTAGTWYVLFKNFEGTYKTVDVTVDSGNATSFIMNGSAGNIMIYYDADDKPHDLIITWEEADKVAKEIVITAPDGTKYSKTETPGSIIEDGYGIYRVHVPYMVSGKYRFDIRGDNLGRVWIDTAAGEEEQGSGTDAPEGEEDPENESDGEYEEGAEVPVFTEDGNEEIITDGAPANDDGTEGSGNVAEGAEEAADETEGTGEEDGTGGASETTAAERK